MKRIAAVVIVCFFLSGCFGAEQEIERGMKLRAQLLSSMCSFTGNVTADYGETIYEFSVKCNVDTEGVTEFTVESPDSIAGISGKISGSGGKLVFSDSALSFPVLADGFPSPVSVPWLIMKTLRSGYITSAATEGEYLHLSIDDSFRDDALHTDIWLDKENLPVRGEILWEGRRALSMNVTDFVFR